MICTFFGHRSVPADIEPVLRLTLIDLIENHGVNRFYVGNQGSFDGIVSRVLQNLAKSYEITCFVVLAYLPVKKDSFLPPAHIETLLPEGIETVPKRFAISYRNKWMVAQSDFVVTYVTYRIGSGAAQFMDLAAKKGKTVINLG